jgi:hypothetical protein
MLDTGRSRDRSGRHSGASLHRSSGGGRRAAPFSDDELPDAAQGTTWHTAVVRSSRQRSWLQLPASAPPGTGPRAAAACG